MDSVRAADGTRIRRNARTEEEGGRTHVVSEALVAQLLLILMPYQAAETLQHRGRSSLRAGAARGEVKGSQPENNTFCARAVRCSRPVDRVRTCNSLRLFTHLIRIACDIL